MKTPVQLGFRMPAEWERQERIWLAWPHNADDWPGKFGAIPWVYVEIIKHITRVERLGLLVNTKQHQREAEETLAQGGIDLQQVDFLIHPTDRVWTRDSGPIFVVNKKKEKALIDWHFNAWAKYDNWKQDDQVPARIAKKFGVKSFAPTVNIKGKTQRVVLEGGSIDVNGKGSLLTTEECLLSKVQQRNKHFTRETYEQLFADYLGVTNTIWLGNGITGDDTHGHVDDLARFVNPTTVVTVVEKNKKDKNYAPLQDNVKRLKKARDERGKQLTVVELPMPAPVIFEDTQLPASYANFLICNDLVLVPTFNDPNDRVACGIIEQLFPRRNIVPIHSVDLVWGFGTIHCMSQQEPLV